MDSLQDRITQAYYRLIDYFLSGVLAFIVLKTLREEYQKHEEIEDDIFAGSLVISAYNTAILALANTLKPNSASIHLPYLIN
jgi:hypothetical protein